nr:helix-turn-helix domain-containing protein [Micromonospora sp. HNM0581]
MVRLRRVRDRIDREYPQPPDVEALARGVNMSAGHLSRQFRFAYGDSPYGYLMTRRIERAMALLRRGDLRVTEVCSAVGCSSLGTFCIRFAALVGVPPTEEERRTISEMMAKGTYASILLATPDLDGVFERLQASDIEIVQEPIDQPYGVRDCAVRAAAGNMICIQEAR